MACSHSALDKDDCTDALCDTLNSLEFSRMVSAKDADGYFIPRYMVGFTNSDTSGQSWIGCIQDKEEATRTPGIGKECDSVHKKALEWSSSLTRRFMLFVHWHQDVPRAFCVHDNIKNLFISHEDAS